MINKLWKITWYAYIGASLLDPRFSIQYIGRYTKRAVMAEYRIVYYDGKILRFSYKDHAEGGKTSYMTLKVHTFIGRLIRHTPDKHFPMIRYAGLLECHDCHEGVVIPGTYKNIHRQVVKIDPKNLDPNTEVIRF